MRTDRLDSIDKVVGRVFRHWRQLYACAYFSSTLYEFAMAIIITMQKQTHTGTMLPEHMHPDGGNTLGIFGSIARHVMHQEKKQVDKDMAKLGLFKL